MSRHSRAAEENTWNIDQAVRQDRPFAAVGGIGGEIYILHLPAVRDVPLPEPVTWRGLNGREPEGWEEPLIVAARERERRAELVLLAGTLGQP